MNYAHIDIALRQGALLSVSWRRRGVYQLALEWPRESGITSEAPTFDGAMRILDNALAPRGAGGPQ